MSNYLALVAASRGRAAVDAWLGAHDDRETRRVELGGGGLLVLRSRDVARRVEGRDFFVGTAIDHEHREIGFGLGGWREMAARRAPDTPLAGEFLALRWTDGAVAIRRDFAGSVALAETHGDGWAAFSDSLLVLAELRRALGASVTANPRAVLARTRTLAVAVQPLSRATALREIAFVPAGEAREIEVHERGIGVRRIPASPRVPEEASAAENARLLRRIAADTVGVVRALASSPQLVPALALSGGVDSRLVLGAALRGGVAEDLLLESWQRTSRNRADYLVARMVREILGLGDGAVTERDLGRDIPYDAPLLSLWASSGLGLYDRILPARPRHEGPRRAVMSGVGAELLKGNYGRRTLADFERFYHVEHVDGSAFAHERRVALMAEYRAGLHAIGAEPDDPDSSERHYWAFRLGVHGAAHASLFLSGVRPLQHPLAFALARTRSGWGRARGLASLDMLALVAPALSRMPFADGRAPFSTEDVEEVAAHYGGAVEDAEIARYAIRGDFRDTWTGPGEYGLASARRAGWDDIETPGEIMRRVREIAGEVGDELLRAVLVEQHPLIENGLVRDGLELRDVSPALATHLSLDLLRFAS